MILCLMNGPIITMKSEPSLRIWVGSGKQKLAGYFGWKLEILLYDIRGLYDFWKFWEDEVEKYFLGNIDREA